MRLLHRAAERRRHSLRDLLLLTTRALGMTALLASAPAVATDAGYLAFGDLRGHVEPCGCDPATDLGGLRRIAALLARERRADPALALFTPGNNVPGPDETGLKTPFVLEAMQRLKTTAYLVNVLELQRLAEIRRYLEAHREARGTLGLVVSNLRPKSPWRALAADAIETPQYVVLGYVSAPGAQSAQLETYGPALAARWRTRLAGVKDRRKILLFAGGNAELAAIIASQAFDEVISSNTSTLVTLPGTAEKDDETRLERKVGRATVFMVPLGGQGLLRGGRLLFDRAKSVAELLQAPPPDCKPGGGLLGGPAGCPPKTGGALIPAATPVTWLDPSYGGQTELVEFFERYNQAARAAFANAGEARAKDLLTSPFAGAHACASCHPAAAAVYAGTAHAHAIATLQAKGKSEDPECVACHVVGGHAKGGFVSLAQSPQLANVQCENCHGPRLAHTRDPTKKLAGQPSPKAACAACHNAQHSPKFDFRTYWPKIAHGQG